MPTRLLRLLSLIAVLAVVAAACGGGDTDAETGAAPTVEGAPAADDDSGAADDAGSSASGDSEAADDGATRDDESTATDTAEWPHTFVADQVGGGQIDANDLAGQDTILWFWAPW